ncbi:hypothetical protein [Sandaracinus amylolyticus]|uniref:hypothetical protein n=1 Tax=Sandaracinus amylolyticus TaxID=927083 RepID=UPI001F33F510|nr:hypothetical protein [Sandaracinus amylolyticus]UJR82324.1 Hypothetical protein I5071_43890 [Sandaracinus amylolyticus]
MRASFDLLTGIVRVAADAPAELIASGTDAFYTSPNDARWSGAISRVLYHESVHLWQLMASGFVANVIGDEWRRLEHFERAGEVRPRSDFVRDHLDRGQGPFSAYELFECWARYWDVHTGNPARLVDEETPGDEIVPAGDDAPAYTWRAFDRFMQTGPDARLYAAPYRTMLERSGADSFFVACVFPAIVHAALGTPAPVRFVDAAFTRALAIHERKALLRRSGNINFDWLNNWSSIVGQVVVPARSELGLPAYTSGFDVIQRGALRTHPIYAQYLERAPMLSQRLELLRRSALDAASPARQAEMLAVRDAPARDKWVLFALPGQPDYRAILGHVLPPPRIRFANATIDARRSALARLAGASETYSAELDALEARVARFMRAERAVSLGLPPSAFES